MFLPKCLSKTAFVSLGLVLATSVSLVGSAFAQVGPQPPEPRRAPDSGVAKAITKLLKGNQGEKTEAAEDADDGQADKPTVNAPAAPTPSSMSQPPQSYAPSHAPLLSQPPLTNARIENPQVDEENPPVLSHPKLDDPSNPLGFADAETKLRKYITLIDANRHMEAKVGLQTLRQWLVDLTEAHIGLYKTLNQVPSARGQAELEKELALQFAQLRDRSMLELAKVYIAEKEYSRAVKELTEVVKSQPRSRMGLRSYEMLQEIGFTEKLQLAQ